MSKLSVAVSSLCALLGLFACAATPAGAGGAGGPAPQEDASLVFAFWNVENLFDAVDDPANPGDDEYLPDREWTADRYARKLDHLSSVLAAIGPHVVGFAEVENRRVLEDLCATEKLRGLGLQIAHVESPDKRGIDVALAYRAPLVLDGADAVRLHEIDPGDNAPTRGVLEVRLAMHGHPLFVLVNHWPSRGGDRDGKFRAVAAAKVREVVDRITADEETAGRDADVLIVGDLNDDPWDASVVQTLGAVRSRNAVLNRRQPRPLYNLSWELLAESDKGTLYYNPEWNWNVFDQAIVSRGMLDASGFQIVEGSFDIYAPDELRDQYRRPRWFRRSRGGEWSEGYSDHFAIHGRMLPPAPPSTAAGAGR